MKANPRYKELQSLLEENAEEFLLPWEGDCARLQVIDYPSEKNILDGGGALNRGGRLNFKGRFPVVYGSLTEETALKESGAYAKKFNFVVRTPRILVVIALKLGRVLDLRNAKIRQKLKITLKELGSEDWEALQGKGFESLGQALGRAAMKAGAEGIIIPSFAHKSGCNVAYFPKNLDSKSSASIFEGEKLPKKSRKKGK